MKEDFAKALEEFNKSASLINKEDPAYINILKSIGQLEYTVYKNYAASISAYSKMLSLVPQDYDSYPKLIKAYYADKQYSKGDSLYNIMKGKYDENLLSDEYKKFGNVAIDEFYWNDQKLIVYKSFVIPEKTLDIMYRIYLLSKDGQSVERTLVTEKTIQIEENGAMHLLCEQGENGYHRTYPYGWSSDNIDYDSLKESILLVLNEKLKPSASSRPAKKKND